MMSNTKPSISLENKTSNCTLVEIVKHLVVNTSHYIRAFHLLEAKALLDWPEIVVFVMRQEMYSRAHYYMVRMSLSGA